MNSNTDEEIRADGAGYKQRVRSLVDEHRDTLDLLD